MGQPCGGIFLPCMVSHKTYNSVLALDFAIPALDGLVDVCIRKGVQQLIELGIGLVNDFSGQALPELGDVGIEMEQFPVAR